MTDPNAPQPNIGMPGRGDAGGESDNLLRHYASILRRRWRWVLLGLVLGLVAGGVSSLLMKEKSGPEAHYYKATNTLAQSSGNVNGTNSADFSISQAALLAQSAELLQTVSDETGLTTEQVAAQLSADIRSNVAAIDVTAISTNPDLAEKIANSGAEKLQEMANGAADAKTASQRKNLESDLTELKAQRQDLVTQLGSNPPDAASLNQKLDKVVTDISDTQTQLESLPKPQGGFNLTVLRPARFIEINARGYEYRRKQNRNAQSQLSDNTSTNTSAPEFDELDLSTDAPIGKSTRILLGGAAGLVLGLISAFLIEAWDDRVRRRERVEELTELGVLAEIPHFTREEIRSHQVAVEDSATGAASERFRAARTAISFAMDLPDRAERGAPVLMITSPGPGEGKTTSAANLAAAFADSGQRVLVIDGDFRRPAIRRFLAPVPNLVAPDAPCDTRIEGVQFLAAPSDAESPDAAVAELHRSITTWRTQYDMVVLDTPPILTTNDAVDLLSAADAVVLVLRADKTRAKPARLVAEMLRRFQADTLGIVLNSCDRTEMNEYYGYGYGYGYSYGYVGKTGTAKDKKKKTGNRRKLDGESSTRNDRPGTGVDTETGAHGDVTANGDGAAQEISTTTQS